MIVLRFLACSLCASIHLDVFFHPGPAIKVLNVYVSLQEPGRAD